MFTDDIYTRQLEFGPLRKMFRKHTERRKRHVNTFFVHGSSQELMHKIDHFDRKSIPGNVSKTGSKTLARKLAASKRIEKLPNIHKTNANDLVPIKVLTNLSRCKSITTLVMIKYPS